MSYQCPTCGTMRSCWESGAVISSMTPHQDRGEVDAAWQKIHVLSSVMEFRALTESERRELHGCHVTIRAALTEAKQQDEAK